MAPLGPWDAARQVAVAVSGGADSVALALLAAAWGRPHALIVDHGLRPAAAAEAAVTRDRLTARGIPAAVLTLAVPPGPRLAERAREARYAALTQAAAAEGLADLLLGHHAGDQAETVLMRARHGSAGAGLAGMAPARAAGPVRLLRPLLGIPPARLRATARAAGLGWVEDASNADPRAERARLRALLAWADGRGPASAGLLDSAAFWSSRRTRWEAEVAAELATHVTWRPEGFAILRAAVSPRALSALVQTIGAAAYPPSPAAVERLAAAVAARGAAALAGVRLMPAGRLGEGVLLVREPAACARPVRADPQLSNLGWDRRFRLPHGAMPPPQSMLGALGDAARGLRRHSELPAVVLRGLPAWWRGDKLLAVPHLCYPDAQACAGLALLFDPPRPASG